VTAGSISLIAFGLDSLIELTSAGVLIWRLNVELRHGTSVAEKAERTASRIGGALDSRALRADAVESITCGWLSFVVLIGVLAQLALGAWWVDALTSLVIVGDC
jgi:divalent metal cation (Fe/Co/Zn/Cd) transporter